MRAMITVVEMMSMRGRYLYSVQVGNKQIVNGRDAGQGPEAAAACAIAAAIRHGGGGYHIFCDRAVSKLIPEDMRSKE